VNDHSWQSTANKMQFDPAGVKFRHAERKDLLALEWEGEFTHFRKLYRDVFHNAQAGEAIVWVAEHSGVKIIGQMFVQLDSMRSELANGKVCAYIYGFRIRRQFRSMGIGTRLLQIAEADLFARGYRKINLNVNRDNDDARRLYRRLGYRVVAAESGRWSYIDHQGRLRQVHEPAWRMEKSI